MRRVLIGIDIDHVYGKSYLPEPSEQARERRVAASANFDDQD